jgi:hypothetical protein
MDLEPSPEFSLSTESYYPDEWFKFDIENIELNLKNSWLYRLAQAAERIVMQWICIASSTTRKGVKSAPYNRESLERLLSHCPTPPTENGKYPAFPFNPQALEVWDEHPESKHNLIERKSIEKDLEELNHHGEKVSNRMEIDLSSNALTESINIGNEDITTTVSDVQLAFPDMEPRDPISILPVVHPSSDERTSQFPPLTLTAKPSNVLGHSVGNNFFTLDPNTIPPAPIVPHVLSQADFAFLYSNNATKLQIAREIGHKEMTSWAMLLATCKRKLKEWAARVADLDTQIEDLEKLKAETEEHLSKAREKAAEVARKEDYVQNALKGAQILHGGRGPKRNSTPMRYVPLCLCLTLYRSNMNVQQSAVPSEKNVPRSMEVPATKIEVGNPEDQDSDDDYDLSANAGAGEDNDAGFGLGLLDKKDE